MKTTMRYLAALLMLGAFAASCNKIDSQNQTPGDNTQVVAPVEMTFTATMAAKDVITRAVDADGVTTWVEDEKIAVYYQKSDDSYGTATAKVDAVNAGVATISAPLTNAKNGGTVKFVYPASLVNATGDDIDVTKLESNQHGTIADISENFDAATGSGTLVTDGSTCGTAATVTLTNQVLIGKFTPKFGGAAIDGITTLTVSDGTNTYTVTPTSGTFGTTGIYVAMLPVSSLVVSLTAGTASARYIYPGKSVTLAAGKLYNNLAISCSKLFTCSSSDWSTQVAAFNAETSDNPVLQLTSNIDIMRHYLILTHSNGIFDLNGHSISAFDIRNDVAGQSLTIRNGIVSGSGDVALDGHPDWADFYRGTVILEDLTVYKMIFVDGHQYIINSGTYNEKIFNVTAAGYPGKLIINGGKFRESIHGEYGGVTYGTYELYGGKYAVRPEDSWCATGYSVKSNTDSDSETYPYIVSAD